ncbi:MAG: zinc-binding dehydrogenase [Rhizobiales bacterium]|nr:zinc-binding dehydrogenase [Hyphomicrobiales bacterium]
MQAYEVTNTSGLDGLVLNPKRPEPEPGPGQILVRVRAAALNARDHGVTRGIYGYTRFPVIPLSDGAGEVVAVGPGIIGFKAGDRVASTFFQTWTGGRMPPDASRNSLGGMLDGMLAELVVLPRTGAIRIPNHLSFEEASTLPCAALTAWNALVETGGIKAGETVAILGTGGVSCFAVQFAKLHRAHVFLTSRSDEKLEKGRALGADVAINYKATPDWEQEMLKQTAGVGVDHVLEVGGANTLEKSMAAVCPGGAIYIIGSLAGAGQINPRMINRKAITLKGIHVGSRDMFAAMNRAIAETRLRPVIDRVFPFADAKAAFAYQAGGSHFGKIVIAVG